MPLPRLTPPLVAAVIGIPAAIVLLELLNHPLLGFLTLLALASPWLWSVWQQHRQRPLEPPLPNPKTITPVQVEQTLEKTHALLEQLVSTAGPQPSLNTLQSQATVIAQDLHRQELRLVLVGHKGVGKTTLRELLTQNLQMFDRPLVIQEAATLVSVPPTDLVLLVITGDLLEPEYQFLQEAQRQQRRVLVVWNKKDQYLSADQQLVLQTLHQRLRALVPPADILAVSAAPLPIQVRHHKPDGTIRQWQEQPEPQLTPLLERLAQIAIHEANQLVVHQTWQQAQALQAQIQLVLNRARRDCAQPILERYQWLAAATAFASPLPALDLLGVGLLTGKLVQELAPLYQHPLSLGQTQKLATTLGSLMLKLGLVEFATQSLGGILKGSGITYLLGATLQGVSSAYLTRLAGLTLVEYFQAQSEGRPASGDLPQQLRRHLDCILKTQRQPEVLQNLVNQALPRLPIGETPLPMLVTPAEMITANGFVEGKPFAEPAA